MSQGIRTLSLLQDYLDEDLAWRIKEMADMKMSVRSAASLRKKTVIRASLALLYAHWEGFIKNAAKAYLEFVGSQGHRYEELASCFAVLGLKKSLAEILQSKQAQTNITALEFIRDELTAKARLPLDSAIRTESNLSSAVFENICRSVGINPSAYETKFNLVDESLLNRRNKIAHGEYIDVNPDQYRDLTDEVLTLLRSFKNDIENAASLKKYKRAA
ncbi:MAG: MAE_28990/MAE_18760 family HEPN-like nuclease [Nitrosospira sp.]